MIGYLIIYLIICALVAAKIQRLPSYAKNMQKKTDEGYGQWYFTAQSFVLVLSIPLILIISAWKMSRASRKPVLTQMYIKKDGNWLLIDRRARKLVGISKVKFNVPVWDTTTEEMEDEFKRHYTTQTDID